LSEAPLESFIIGVKKYPVSDDWPSQIASELIQQEGIRRGAVERRPPGENIAKVIEYAAVKRVCSRAGRPAAHIVLRLIEDARCIEAIEQEIVVVQPVPAKRMVR
jgi:hypothetical protein